MRTDIVSNKCKCTITITTIYYHYNDPKINPCVKALPYREKHGNIWFKLPKKFTPLTLYASTI